MNVIPLLGSVRHCKTDELTGSDNGKFKEKNDCIVDNDLRRDNMSIQEIDLVQEVKSENNDSNILMQSHANTSKSVVMPTRSAENKSQLEDKRRRKDELLSKIENDPSVSKRHRSKNMKWGDFYRRLEDFKIALGHCNVPNLYPPDYRLCTGEVCRLAKRTISIYERRKDFQWDGND